MDGNATPRHAWRRASLATSSITIPADSRGPAACRHGVVITLSTVVMHFDTIFRRNEPRHRRSLARIMLNDVATSTFFINSKPRFGLSGGSQSPLSGADASCPAGRRGLVVEKARGGSPLAVR